MAAFINVLMGMPVDCRGVNTLKREELLASNFVFFFFANHVQL